MSGYNPYASGAGGYNNGGNMQQMDHGNNMMMANDNGMDSNGGQSLDDIVNQNMRGQSMSAHYNPNSDLNDMSMMDFTGHSPNGPLDHFSFDPSNMGGHDVMNSSASMNMSDQNMLNPRRLSLNTAFANSQSYNSNMSHQSQYQSGSSHNNNNNNNSNTQGLEMDMNSPYLSNSMGMNMDFGNTGNVMGMDQNSMSMYPYSQAMMTSPMANSNMNNSPMTNPTLNNSPMTNMNNMNNNSMNSNMSNMSKQRGSLVPDVSISGKPNRFDVSRSQSSSDVNTGSRPSQSRSQSMHTPTMASQSQSSGRSQSQYQSQHQQQPQSQPIQQRHSLGSATQRHQQAQHNQPSQPDYAAQAQADQQTNQQTNQQDPAPEQRSRSNPGSLNNPNVIPENLGLKTPDGGWPSSMAGRTHMESNFANAYSSTGFDMLGVLMRVATRPNPEINIGSVDLSCAFVVCDAEKDDIPIVYCSDNFERLTGYTRHMILGRNCRFLQSPNARVMPGVKRKYVDDDSVLYLKNQVNTRKEAQISLINYRRGGQPFMNLLTVIPITWDSDQVKFYVGFQVDLVEQPNAVTDRNPDGSYTINYQRGLTMPRYIVNSPETDTNKAELGQTIPRDDVSAILSTIGSGESDYAKRMWDKVLLENTDDVVHVLSLKGLFQWVSPSSVKVLEYEPAELIGTALSSVCHPSDIVPVTRELKDTSSGAAVNVVFRIRRKNSGYMWFEGHGSLHTEQGKGRKSIILVGRERPVYTLSKADILANSGIGENELWTKMSTSGMFLYVSSSVRQLLDRQPDELIGISIQSLMRADSKSDFVRILEHARTGKKASTKHEMINRRGQVLQAFTTLYPGDATEGQKPTFIVAQTRLIKYPRGNGSGRPNAFGRDRGSDSSIRGTASNQGDATPMSGGNTNINRDNSVVQYIGTPGAAATYGGNNGLVLGHQDESLASDDNLFDELKTTKSSSWQYEIRQLEKRNRMLAEEVQSLLMSKKKRKRRKGAGQMQKDCANCHTRVTPEWRRGPSGQRDLCNSCGLRWAKLNGRVSPRTTSQQSGAGSDRNSQTSASPQHFPSSAADINNQAAMPVKLEAQRSTGSSTGDNGHGHGQGLERQGLERHTSYGSHGHGGYGNGGHGLGNGVGAEGHAIHMEGASGVPEKIEEDDEEPE